MLTYADIPIPDLARLGALTRRRLLRRLDADCAAAAIRNAAILRARWLAASPTARHDTRRTA